MVNEPMMVAARQLHDEARKWSSKVSQHCKPDKCDDIRNLLIATFWMPNSMIAEIFGFHTDYVLVVRFREMTSSVLPNEWPSSWPRCHAWCAEAVGTNVRSSSAPKTSRRLLTKSRGWLRRWPSSAPTNVSEPTCSRSVQPSSSRGGTLTFYFHVVFINNIYNSLFRCVSAFPPSARSSKSFQQ